MARRSKYDNGLIAIVTLKTKDGKTSKHRLPKAQAEKMMFGHMKGIVYRELRPLNYRPDRSE